MDINAGGFKSTDTYIASHELMSAVNVARALSKPLLIKGEPGTGKTMLARAIAESLDMPLISYDTIQRLYDGQFGEEGVDDIKRYIKLGKLGEAFSSDVQVVLLIDEIDKADLEFPNDLLWELDQMEFYIHETKETIKAKHRPVVIITSNAEKELPDAFLRRCVFHYIAFPERELMDEIVRTHFEKVDEHILSEAMDVFYQIRDEKSIKKKPSTSELIDWVNALQLGGISADRIKAALPFIGTVIKKDEDLETVSHMGIGS